MALDVTLTPGTLPQPACYANEQDRFDAYVDNTIVNVSGGIQWVTQQDAPADKTAYWLRTDSSGLPIGAYVWETADGAWVPWQYELLFGTGGGSLNAFTVTNTPAIGNSALFMVGRMISFLSTQTITGPATVSVDGGPSHAIKKAAVQPLIAGDILAGQMVVLMWDGTNWQIQNPIYPAPGATGNYFDSGLQAVPTGDHGICGPFAHGLAGKPQFVQWWLVCNTSPQSGTGSGGPVVLGYSVGDAIKLESVGNLSDSNTFIPLEADATYVQAGGFLWAAVALLIPQKNGSAAGGQNGGWVINPSDWRLQCFATYTPPP